MGIYRTIMPATLIVGHYNSNNKMNFFLENDFTFQLKILNEKLTTDETNNE